MLGEALCPQAPGLRGCGIVGHGLLALAGRQGMAEHASPWVEREARPHGVACFGPGLAQLEAELIALGRELRLQAGPGESHGVGEGRVDVLARAHGSLLRLVLHRARCAQSRSVRTKRRGRRRHVPQAPSHCAARELEVLSRELGVSAEPLLPSRRAGCSSCHGPGRSPRVGSAGMAGPAPATADHASSSRGLAGRLPAVAWDARRRRASQRG